MENSVGDGGVGRGTNNRIISNKSSSSDTSTIRNDNHYHHHYSLTSINKPINNLCYQSVPIDDRSNRNFENKMDRKISKKFSDYFPSVIQNKSILKQSSSNIRQINQSNLINRSGLNSYNSVPIVSFKNNGEEKIAIKVLNETDNHRLYSMNLTPKFDGQWISQSISSDSNCYVSIDSDEPESDLLLLSSTQSSTSPSSTSSTSFSCTAISSLKDSLIDENWYYGPIDRFEAVDLITNYPTGSFVVRKSSSSDGCFALTVRVPYDYNHSGVSHYLIQQTGDQKYKIKGFQKEFQTISSLIIHHSIMKEQLPCTLRLILHKFDPSIKNDSDQLNYNPTITSASLARSTLRLNQVYVYDTNRTNGKEMKYEKRCKQNFNENHGTNFRKSSSSSSQSYYLARKTDLDLERMVDIDIDPTYQRILENFRRAMAHYS
ncbi:SH2 domain-containing adapter F-like protein [Sarcoptes scabiei]|nr:SH2 domain-containing adapter F-like protein [Sarcoptes scabiei]